MDTKETAFRRLRHAVGVTQQEMAERLELSLRTVQALDCGERKKSRLAERSLRLALRCSADIAKRIVEDTATDAEIFAVVHD